MRSEHELLSECVVVCVCVGRILAFWQQPRPMGSMHAAAHRVATWLLLLPISPGYAECVQRMSVIEFHTCHSQQYTALSVRYLCTLL